MAQMQGAVQTLFTNQFVDKYIKPNSPEIKKLLEEKKLVLDQSKSERGGFACAPNAQGGVNACIVLDKNRDLNGPNAIATLISDLVHNGLHVSNLINKGLKAQDNKAPENEKSVATQTAAVLGKIIEQIKKEDGPKAPVALELIKLRARQLEIAQSGKE